MRVGLFALISTAAMAGAPYLPKIGPVLMRFQQLPARLNPSDVLPPLKMADDPPPTKTETNGTEQVETTIGPVPPVEPQTPAPPVTETAPAPPPSADPAVTPQMLLRFFNQGSNKEALIQAPLEFTPPQPGKSSSATYTSP